MSFEEPSQEKPGAVEPPSGSSKTVTKTGTISLPAGVLKQPKGGKAKGEKPETGSATQEKEMKPKQVDAMTISESQPATSTTGGEEENPWFTVSTSGTGVLCDRSGHQLIIMVFLRIDARHCHE